jgi:hypothetical protein
MKNPIPMSQWTDEQWEKWEEEQDYKDYLANLRELEEIYLDDDVYFDTEKLPWTDEDEAALEEWEEQRRIRIAENNEY